MRQRIASGDPFENVFGYSRAVRSGDHIFVSGTTAQDPHVEGCDAYDQAKNALGIIEQVSTFTTEHACCQNRVTNIQRFADLTQGLVVRPGEELSLNGFVGRRTTEKGFVADGAIAYQPDAGFSGTDTFTYLVCTTAPVCAEATVTVQVVPVSIRSRRNVPRTEPYPISWLLPLLFSLKKAFRATKACAIQSTTTMSSTIIIVSILHDKQ